MTICPAFMLFFLSLHVPLAACQLTRYKVRNIPMGLCLKMDDSRPRKKFQEEALGQVWYYTVD